jgi:hypothetical protein
MPAVLLRMAGLDALDLDAEPQPPDRELGELKQSMRRGEWNSVVGADRARQAAFLEQALKGGKGEIFPVGSSASHNSK